jgi:hypothetical protein
MSDASVAGAAADPAFELDRDKVAMALGDRTRWKILAELSTGEPRMVSELAKLLGRSSSVISRHMGALGYAGMAVCERRLWLVPARFVVPGGKRQLDFGHCLLRFPAPAGR